MNGIAELEKMIEHTKKCVLVLQENIEDYKKQIALLRSIPVDPKYAQPGDILDGGWVVICREGNRVLVAAPKEKEILTTWAKRNDALKGLPSDCFIPNIERMHQAYKIPDSNKHFDDNIHWVINEDDPSRPCCLVAYYNYDLRRRKKKYVRAFRWHSI